MSDFNFSMTNPKIKAFFNGDDTDPPITELLYLHEHPLIRESFLREIIIRVKEGTDLAVRKNIQLSESKMSKLVKTTSTLGAELSSISKNNALEVLKSLRAIDTFMKTFIKDNV